MSGLNAATSFEPAADAVAPLAVFLDRDLAVVFANRAARECRALWAHAAAAAAPNSLPSLRLPPEVLRACVRLGATPTPPAGGLQAGQVVTVSCPLAGLTAVVEACSSCGEGGDPAGFLVHFSAEVGPRAGETGGGKSLISLSPSEEQVARLVAMGRSNRAVARELGKSERTVECQLSAIYRKLGVANRVQLCRALLAAAWIEGLPAGARAT
jgi:DNA-binding CsgD family transcriptional regulator